MTPSCHVKQHLQPEFRWVYKAPSRLSLWSEVEAREPTPVACMFRPYRTRGQWGGTLRRSTQGGCTTLILSTYPMQLQVLQQVLAVSSMQCIRVNFSKEAHPERLWSCIMLFKP
jgi:hypothetical protein